MGNTERFVVALVGSPFGLTGRVKITPPSGEEAHLFDLKNVILRLQNDKKEYVEKEYLIEEVFYSPLSVKFWGIDSPEAAKTLNGAEILVTREQAAPLYEGEFYIEDLRGLNLVNEGKTIGIINDVFEGGSGFLVEVLLESGEKRLVPFRDEFFGLVDPAADRVELLNNWILE